MSAVVENQIQIDEWRGLYKESWKGLIRDDAFAHPAKFSRALIRRIYDHVIEEGWAIKGSSVVDPFGGVALGAFDAMRHGLNWYGCELEAKFVGLGGQNIALWNERFSRMPNWGTARLLQGDSRKLGDVIREADCCVTSPPYADFGQNQGTDNKRDQFFTKKQGDSANVWREGYGNSTGQLGAMKEGDHGLAITSPPYNLPMSQDHNGSRGGQRGTTPSEKGAFVKYGTSEGQLEGMSMEGFNAAVTSPPYEAALVGSGADAARKRIEEGRYKGIRPDVFTSTGNKAGASYGDNYGTTEGNLGSQRGETFWSASRLILEQLQQIIIPSGHAVFVVKTFVRDKKIVDFPAQWAQLCEAVGFTLLHDHHALLTEHYGTQGGFDEDKKLSVERKSFFRRLAESKGSPRIDHENVLCFERR